MFDIFKNSHINKNPLLASEFIKIIPAFELVKNIIQSQNEDRSEKIINNDIIKNGILKKLFRLIGKYRVLAGLMICNIQTYVSIILIYLIF